MPKPKITFVHLYNDFSGSPLILATIAKDFRKDFDVRIITCARREGFLSGISGAEYTFFEYKLFANKFLRLFALLYSQFLVFFKVFFLPKQPIYINTLLPFGAALGAWFSRKPIFYHIHETSLKPLVLKSFLLKIAYFTAEKVIFVSHFLQEKEGKSPQKEVVIHNALSQDFLEKSKHFPKQKNKEFTILMLASLKEYKGIMPFISLAKTLSAYRFELVLNATQTEIDTYFEEAVPDNCQIFPSQKNVHPFYQRADLVLNLSLPDQWIETFGMTLLEAFHYGIPCLCPLVGGPLEVVDNGVNGYYINPYEIDTVAKKIIFLAENEEDYKQFSLAALRKAEVFSSTQMLRRIRETLAASLIHSPTKKHHHTVQRS